MASSDTLDEIGKVPHRADARRNYDSLITAAREIFGEQGSNASLEAIAKKAGVGIGTLYRHFPTRRELFEAVYVNEVRNLCNSADQDVNADPWEALSSWLYNFVQYAQTKKGLAEELIDSFGNKSGVFMQCRAAIYPTGEPLLKRAQEAKVVRDDMTFDDVLKMVSGMTMIQFSNDKQMAHILDVALDGLRYRA